MENSEIRLILLDFDGTLADTRRANTLAYVAALGEAGYKLTEEEYAAHYFGMRCDEFLTRLGIADAAERERIRLRKIALYPSFFDTVRLNVPLLEFCRQFRTDGGRVWVVSTGSTASSRAPTWNTRSPPRTAFWRPCAARAARRARR